MTAIVDKNLIEFNERIQGKTVLITGVFKAAVYVVLLNEML